MTQIYPFIIFNYTNVSLVFQFLSSYFHLVPIGPSPFLVMDTPRTDCGSMAAAS